MNDYDTEEFLKLAQKANANNSDLVYHPSIREIVRYLARRAAEKDYSDHLAILAAANAEGSHKKREDE